METHNRIDALNHEKQAISLALAQSVLTGLTSRQREVLELINDPHLTYRQVGETLSISEETVKSHVLNIADKLGITGGHRAVVAVARERGLLVDPLDNPETSQGWEPS